jgi:hypothetical protein
MARKYRILPVFSSQDVNRFWSNVKKLQSGCWEWQRPTGGHRYGHLVIAKQNVYAHRMAYKIYYLTDPMENLVCHSCDNTLCVNPFHLFLGTQQSNVDDMHRKGRHARGKMVPQSKLSEGQILDIRENYKPREPGQSMYALATKYCVSPATIFRAIHNVAWKHI